MKRQMLAVLAALAMGAGIAPAQEIQPPRAYPALGAPDNPKVPIRWNRYYNSSAMSDYLQQLAQAHPNRAELVFVGKSHEGRDIWSLEVTNKKTGPASSKPAMFIDGNIHGNEAQAGEVVLYTAWWLLEMADRVELVDQLLDERAFYLLPSTNPDGRDHWLEDADNNPHTNRGGRIPVDNDGDGALDEDGPNDLDGDGMIRQMRIRDPFGRHRKDPDFPNYLMVEVPPNEVGEYRMLGSEGFDDDGDGDMNEDGPGGYDPNRNWAWDWEPEATQRGAHHYPFSLPETRAVADYVLARPNIAAAQSYHNNGGMILRPPGNKDAVIHDEDDWSLHLIAERGTKMLPEYRNLVTWKDLYTVYGGQIEWFYGGLGILSFTNEMWTENNLYRRGDVSQQDRARFIRHLLMNEGLAEWKEVGHPQYGKVEVGGMAKNWSRVPPSFLLEEELHRNMAFTLYHAECMPLIRIGEITVQPVGEGLHEVLIQIENHGTIATRTRQDVVNNITPWNRVTLTGSGIQVVASGIRENPLLDRVRWQERRPEELRLDTVRGLTRAVAVFLVSGSGAGTVTVDAARGGVREESVTIPR